MMKPFLKHLVSQDFLVTFLGRSDTLCNRGFLLCVLYVL